MICACGKAKMDGIRCKLGASHVSLEMYRKTLQGRGLVPVSYATKPVAHRERLPIKRERLDTRQGRFF